VQSRAADSHWQAVNSEPSLGRAVKRSLLRAKGLRPVRVASQRDVVVELPQKFGVDSHSNTVELTHAYRDYSLLRNRWPDDMIDTQLWGCSHG
jgi:hypothetical protein